MRPFEILLLLVNLLTFFILAVPLPRTVHWMGYLALITVLIAGIQILAEGPRWQMVPTYVLTVLFSLAGLLQNFPPTGGIIGQILTNSNSQSEKRRAGS